MRKKVAIIVIGNEVLNGSTLDTNSNFMCQFIQAHGSTVVQISTIPDNFNTIIDEFNHIANKQVDVIVTFGGLGPTNDDITIQAISSAIKKNLSKNKVAMEYINKRYKELGEQGIVSLSPSNEALKSREKMAYMPSDAIPLFNSIGAAPAILMSCDNLQIICFPGVPREVSAICSHYDESLFKTVFGSGTMVSYRIITSSNDESELAKTIKEISLKYPDLYIKSRPIYSSYNSDIGITVTGTGDNKNTVEAHIKNAIEALADDLAQSQITITTKERVI